MEGVGTQSAESMTLTSGCIVGTTLEMESSAPTIGRSTKREKHMKKVFLMGSIAVALLAVPTFVSADTATGTLAVTGTVASSISLTVENGTVGPTLTGAGTDAASTDLGTTFSKYGSTPAGFTKTLQGTTSWTLSSDFGVKVEKANSDSTNYTLVANLSTDPGTVVWNAGGTPFVAVAAKNLTSTGVYATTTNYAWSIVIPDALTTPDLANTINFLATSN